MSFRLRPIGSLQTRAVAVAVACAAVGVALSAGPALGELPKYPDCTRQATKQETDAAKGAHTAAKGFFDKQDYDRAIRSWRDAYDFDCNAHPLLINIANAYEKKWETEKEPEAKKEHLRAAVFTIETFLRRAGYDKEQAERRNKWLDILEPPKPSATPSAPPPPPPPSASAPPPPPPQGPRPFGMAPIGLAAGGGALVIVGAILVPVALNDISVANENCPIINGVGVCTTPEFQQQGVRGNALGITGAISLGLGVAGVTGGLVWHFAFNKPKAMPAPQAGKPNLAPVVIPVVGPGSVGVAGKF